MTDNKDADYDYIIREEQAMAQFGDESHDCFLRIRCEFCGDWFNVEELGQDICKPCISEIEEILKQPDLPLFLE